MAGLRGSSIVLRSALELFSMFKIFKVYSLWHWWSRSTFDITFTMNSWDDFKPFVFNHQFFSGCSKYLASHITGGGLCIFDKEFKFETDSFWYFRILLCSKIYIFKSETWGHETLVFAIIFSSISLNAFRTPLVKWHTPRPPHARGGYHMISTLINSMCISTYSRVQCKRSHKSFTKTKLRFHTLVDQDLAFDKKGGYQRVKAAVKLTNGPWKFFPNAVVEFDAKMICLQHLASYIRFCEKRLFIDCIDISRDAGLLTLTYDRFWRVFYLTWTSDSSVPLADSYTSSAQSWSAGSQTHPGSQIPGEIFIHHPPRVEQRCKDGIKY